MPHFILQVNVQNFNQSKEKTKNVSHLDVQGQFKQKPLITKTFFKATKQKRR